MRIAVISDMHGNAVAFEAVVAAIGRAGVERVVCLGDAVQGGAQPAAVVARLRDLGWPVVMGNADHFLLHGLTEGEDPAPHGLLLAVREWSLSKLTEEDRGFIAGFQPAVELPLPDGRRLMCGHGTPSSFNDIIVPETPDDEIRRLLGEVGDAIVRGGHTHVQQLRPLGDALFFNPGSISLPFRRDSAANPPMVDRWAEWAMLTVEADGLTAVEFRRQPYDVDAAVAIIRASGMPEPEALANRYRMA